MDELVNVLLAIDKVITVPQRALNCRPGLGELSQVYMPNCPTLSAQGSVAIITSLPDVQIAISCQLTLLDVYLVPKP